MCVCEYLLLLGRQVEPLHPSPKNTMSLVSPRSPHAHAHTRLFMIAAHPLHIWIGPQIGEKWFFRLLNSRAAAAH